MFKIPYDTLIMMYFTENEKNITEEPPQKAPSENKKTATLTENKHGFPTLNIF